MAHQPSAQTDDALDLTVSSRSSESAARQPRLELLQPADQQVVQLRLDGYSIAEVAAILHCSYAAAAKRCALTFLAALPLTYLAASFGGRALDHSYGWLWVLPAASAAGCCLFLLAAFLRVPATATD
ncbi:hypothetical protein [Serinicoccus marinus]|uniref:hypothetical protein n=1 Tax=Serinicoccus marinus TaxID=247333 RepID=UPI002492E8C6|nr:hypothetical protein [Serinicoccus marinus]